MSDAGALLDEGIAALARGEWTAAIASFESVLERTESPDARLGLGSAHMWLGEMAVAVRCFERAYGEFCQRDDVVNAVLTATNLSLLHHANFGNRAAAAGWAARASRLAEGVPVLEGWAAMASAANSEDPDEAQRLASGARAVAVEAGDRDLELCAMSVEGSALVDAGRVEAGAALLDEALAGAIGGEVESPDTVVMASCLMMQCCVRGGRLRPCRRMVARARRVRRPVRLAVPERQLPRPPRRRACGDRRLAGCRARTDPCS